MNKAEKAEVIAYYLDCCNIPLTAGEFGVSEKDITKWANIPEIVDAAARFKGDGSQRKSEFTYATVTTYLSRVINTLDNKMEKMSDGDKIRYANLLKDLLTKDTGKLFAKKQSTSLYDEIMEKYKRGELTKGKYVD